MNLNSLAKHYASLSPEERFRLILAAGARDDQSEQRRLISAGKSVSLSVQDHAPLAYAFEQTATHVYLELIELAARYVEAMRQTNAEDDGEATSALDLALAIGFQLKATADGWELFCATTHVAPFALWEHLPGFSRLQNALVLADKASFTASGFVCWLNASRVAEKPPLTRAPLSPESVADDVEKAFRKAAAWWSGGASSAATSGS